jgi:hypothetical protein
MPQYVVIDMGSNENEDAADVVGEFMAKNVRAAREATQKLTLPDGTFALAEIVSTVKLGTQRVASFENARPRRKAKATGETGKRASRTKRTKPTEATEEM